MDAYDVVIFGVGSAAICAAMSTRRHTERVRVLESAPASIRAGNSQSLGLFAALMPSPMNSSPDPSRRRTHGRSHRRDRKVVRRTSAWPNSPFGRPVSLSWMAIMVRVGGSHRRKRGGGRRFLLGGKTRLNLYYRAGSYRQASR
jgi:hypothetical protein